MIEYRVDEEIQTRVAEARELGRKELRPAGLDADRKGAPIPRDDPFFDRCIERGEGRTSWAGPGEARPKRRRRSIVEGLLVAEELAYWDRGVINSMPGPGLPENNVLSMGTDEHAEVIESITDAVANRCDGGKLERERCMARFGHKPKDET